MSTQYTYTKPANLMNLPSNISRTGSGPLDNSAMFASIDDLEYFISKGKKEGLTLTAKFKEYTDSEERGYIADFFKPYVGQIISAIDVNDNNKLKIFQITELDDDAKVWKYQKISPLNGKQFDFSSKNIGEIIKELIIALDGTVIND